MLSRRWLLLMGCIAVLVAATFAPRPVSANHSWGGYHWEGMLPVALSVGDNLTIPTWADHLVDAVADWNNPTGGATQSVSLDITFGGSADPSSCAPTLGRIEVCNWQYGDNGWLGLAQVWVYRGRDKHIAQATTLLNDTYFNLPVYNTWAWRQMVMCQEIAHDFGLDHQDEGFSNYNLGTCMDYTSAPEGNEEFGPANTSPNQHDFDELEAIYAHQGDGGGSGGGGGGGGGGNGGGRGRPQPGFFEGLPAPALQRVPIDSPATWGQLVRSSGRTAVYELDLGNGFALFTFVTWA